jgi:hypothetical protein
MALEIYHQHLAPVAPAVETRPVVSVVIPLYNKRSSIGRAVHSVLDQSFEDLELIVVDDGSDDGSSEVLRFLSDPRMRVIRQPNQGVSVARNRGILEARGEYLAFLDGDDEWEADFLDVLLDVLDRFSEVQVAGASYHVQRPDRSFEPLAPLFGEGQAEVVVDFFEAARQAPPLSLFATTGLFPPGIHHGEDLDQWLRVGLACADKGIALTRRTASVWHLDADNRAGQHKARPHRLPSVDRVLAAPREFPRAVREFVSYMLIQQAYQLRRSGYRWRSLRWLWDARGTRRHRLIAFKELAKTFVDFRKLPTPA